MAKLTLIKPPERQQDWYKSPLLGISYLAAVLESNGHEVQLIDAYFEKLTVGDIVSRVVSFRPDVVAVTAMTHEIFRAEEVAAAIRARLSNVHFVVGGAHPTALPERTLNECPSFDYAVYGEGELTMVELVQALENEDKIQGIRGIACRDAGRAVRTQRREWIEDLDALPFPAYHHYGKFETYRILTSRGCPFHCSFCMRALGERVRRRSAENVLAEIGEAVRRYAVREIVFADEIFLMDDERTNLILDGLLRMGWSKKISWRAHSRINYVKRQLVAKAKRAGCCQLSLGVESGNDAILRSTRKGVTVDMIWEAVRTIKGVGIPLVTYYILGHPNETRATIHDTIRLLTELNTDSIAVGLMVPYPGTEVYRLAKAGEAGYRLLSEDWKDYDKYGGRALELQGVPHDELEKLQRRAYLSFFLKNMRYLDMMKYLWPKRKAVFAMLCRRKVGKWNPE